MFNSAKSSTVGTEYIETFPQHDRPLDCNVFTVRPTSTLIPIQNGDITDNIEPTTADTLLKEILKNHETLKFYSQENFGMTGCIEGKTVHMLGVDGESIMSASLIPLTVESSEEKIIHSVGSALVSNTSQKMCKCHQNQQHDDSQENGDIDIEKLTQYNANKADQASTSYALKFKDIKGTSIISCYCFDELHNYSVYAGDRLIGHFNGLKESFLWRPKLYIQNTARKKMYDVKREGSKFTLTSNGVIMAKGELVTSEKHTVQLKFGPLIDFDTRAMIIVTAWWIYVFYFARTRWCFSGIVKISNCFMISLMATFVSVCIILAILER